MKNKLFLVLIGIFFAALLFSPDYDYKILNRGIYFHHATSAEQLIESEKYEQMLFYKEGLYDTIVVTEQKEFLGAELEKPTYFDSLKVLKINGKIQCGTGKYDMTTTTLLGGLPLLLQKDPKSALNVGSGCGIVLGVLKSYPLETIDTVEIDPAVVEASKQFNDIHDNALDDPRVHVLVTDARNLLLTNEKKYDIIVCGPSHPWSAPSSNLFTREFLEMERAHLNEDGLVAQWFPTATISLESFKVFYKTFTSVFPYVDGYVSKVPVPNYKFFGNGSFEVTYDWDYGEIILIGSTKPIEVSNEQIEKRFQGGLAKQFERVKIEDINEYYFFNQDDLKDFVRYTPVNTDDNAVIEFLTAKDMYASTYGKTISEILKLKEAA